MWRRLRQFVVHRVLQLDDTPPRIALGVALGFFVAWTPTIGLQMLLYFLCAALLGANKVAGLGPVWITNPFTAVPIYYTNLKVGQWLLHGLDARDPRKAEVTQALAMFDDLGSVWTQLWEADFWARIAHTLWLLGIELWLGSLAVGAGIGAVSYFATYRAVVVFRARKAEREALRSGPDTA